jgi:flagellar biosynthetic protein FliR
MAALAELSQLSAEAGWHFFVVFLRVAALVALLPGFGERSLPVRIRLALAFCLVLVTAPSLPPMPLAPDFPALLRLILTESLAGLLFGLGLRLFVLALQTAGSIAAQSTSLAQILGGAAADPVPAMGYILVVAALALALAAGLHVKAALLVILSYQILPMGLFPGAEGLSAWGTAQVARAFALAFSLAAPFVILSVLYNIALGAINRAMPQLMVAFVGAPVITAGGLFLLFLAAPTMLAHWLAALDAFMAAPDRVRGP